MDFGFHIGDRSLQLLYLSRKGLVIALKDVDLHNGHALRRFKAELPVGISQLFLKGALFVYVLLLLPSQVGKVVFLPVQHLLLVAHELVQ